MMSSPPSQFNYPLPKVSITASQVGKRIIVSLGGSFQQDAWVELNNESPYVLSIFSAQGILLQSLQPQVVDIAQIPSGDNFFLIVPNLLIPQASPSSEVDINVYPFGKPEGAYPFPLGRQAAPIDSSSITGYVAFITNNGTVLAINIFNPLNSGVAAIFLSAQVSSDSTSDTSAIAFQTGSDTSLGLTLTPHPLLIGGGTSKMKVTASITGIPGTSNMDQVLHTPSGVVYEYLPFPKQIQLNPGNDFAIWVQDTAAQNQRLALTWKEQ